MNNYQWKLYKFILKYNKSFIDFLRENNILLEFFWRIRSHDLRTDSYYAYMQKNHIRGYLITEPFIWIYTKERFDFWKEINNKWIIYSSKNK